ncbi:sulfotransferase 6B1-like [Empidonax traillii]|uniref:sulfotransferase 6B1-like n=1 Tax=Empidonax traillii TaxID=164674 RepID=UPI000FFD0682|nr:sulfotransferase 6B1-like [Empidonax traillii]
MEKSRKKFTDLLDKATVEANSMRHEELMFSYNGTPYPTTLCSPETFRALESFEARSDDIILAGYPKSGTNWLTQILTDLVTVSQKKTQDREGIANYELEEFPYLEVGDAEKYERMTKLPSPRFMITHLRPENLPKSIFKNKVKILLLIRNPKDVATSFYHFSKGLASFPSYETWDDFFTDFMSKRTVWGCYFEYLSQWNKYADEENVMAITYEELKEVRLSITTNTLYFKEHVFLNQFTIIFMKSGVSDWKNLFSEDQNEKMDKAFEEYVGGTKLGKKLKYEVYCKA